jgi:hypothetical protein
VYRAFKHENRRDTAERSVCPAADRPALPRLAAESASGTRSRAGARFRCLGAGVFSILIDVLAYNIKICHSVPGDGAQSSV